MNKLIAYLSVKKIHVILLLLLAIGIRSKGFLWDGYRECTTTEICHTRIYHFHPDERMLIMVADRISWVNPIINWDEFVQKSSAMNPNFFAYGSFPIYLLAFCGYLYSLMYWFISTILYSVLSVFVKPDQPLLNSTYFYAQSQYWLGYDGLIYIGRSLSIGFDALTLLMIYHLGRLLSSHKAGLLSGAVYAIAVLPVQLSHFFTVDTVLTFFITAVLFLCVKYIKDQSLKNKIYLVIAFGLAVASKLSGLILIMPIGLTLLLTTFLHIKNQDQNFWDACFDCIKNGLLIVLLAGAVTIITQPFMIIDWHTYLASVKEQSRMGEDPWVFPYTRQYVHTKAYVYPFMQITKWGLGYGLAGISYLALGWAAWNVSKNLIRKKISFRVLGLVVLISFMSVYFLVWGRFSVKFMRYMLPLYPLLMLLVGLLLDSIWKKTKNHTLGFLPIVFTFSSAGIWLVAFWSIYQTPNTRIMASRWVSDHVRAYSHIAVEHWDDQVPVPPWDSGYTFTQLPLYEYDSPSKWPQIASILADSDVVILASNRLSAPLARLPERYPQTAVYYEKLFNGELDFQKSADFHIMPHIGPLQFDTQQADESFQVYDHPQVVIFTKTAHHDPVWYIQQITGNSLLY